MVARQLGTTLVVQRSVHSSVVDALVRPLSGGITLFGKVPQVRRRPA